MEFAKNMMVILLTAILAENFILTKFLGICPFLGVSKKLDSALGMSAAVIFVMVIATAVTFPIYVFLLDPYDLAYMETGVFILVIAALVQLVEMVLKKFMPALHRALGVYLPLITTNCAVLGVAYWALRCWISIIGILLSALALRLATHCCTRLAPALVSCWQWSCLPALEADWIRRKPPNAFRVCQLH